MSLVKKPVMTEKNLSAHRRNAQQSRGTITPEGKERGRAANLRHGAYSQMRDEALVALGEDPAQLTALVAGAHEQWRPANPFQGWIVDRLARLQWRIQRAERMQESLAVQRIERVLEPQRKVAQEIRRRHALQAQFLDLLQYDVARPDFYAPPGYFRDFAHAFEGMMTASLSEIHRLLHRLRKPRQFPPAAESAPAGATCDGDWQVQVEELEAVKFPIPQPKIPVAQGAERDSLRAELLQAVLEERQVTETATKELLEETENSLSTFDRDQLAASVDGQIDLLRRQEESCFRQFWRMGSFLMKLQDRMEQSENEVSGQESEVRSPGSEVCNDDVDASRREFTMKENEGASGDVDENSGGGVGEGTPMCRTLDSDSSQESLPTCAVPSIERVECNAWPAEAVAGDRLPGANAPLRTGTDLKKAGSGLPVAA